MAYQSLYRRYRSRTFSEVLGQPHVTSALRGAVAENRYGHAYLFSGPRGTGKTSTARVLAKALNCANPIDGEPCCECESCLAIEEGRSFDLHELDAASHNKVDDIRELISKVQLGSPGRTKVYILDEVHMLSSGAENALLKTLEEPPDHVVFVLATTEPQKVVATIRSRTQHHEFHLLPAEVLADHVRRVIDDAGLDVDDDAIDFVLRQGGGSARDTLSALDLVASAGGVPEGSDIAELLLRAIGDHDPARAIATVQEGLALGREPRTIGEDLLELLRNAFLASMGAPLDHLNDRMASTVTELSGALGPAALTRSLEAVGTALVEMRQAADPRIPLEVTLLRLTRSPSDGPSSQGGDATTSGIDVDGAGARIEALERRVADLEARLASAVAPGAGEPTSAGGPGPQAPRRRAQGPSDDIDDSLDERGAPTGAGDTPPHPPSRARSERGSAGDGRRPSPPPRRGRSERRPRPRDQAPPQDQASISASAGAPTEAPTGTPADATGNTPSATSTDPAGSTPSATSTDPAGSTPSATSTDPAGSTSADATAAPDTAPSSPAPVPSGTGRGAPLTEAAATAALASRLDDLSQRVRARFKGGRIVEVAGDVVRFGVPNSIHRDRCDDVKDEVAAALSHHFEQPVSLEIVVDQASAPPPDPARPAVRPPPTAGDEEEIGPVHELADATDQAAGSLDRLTKAFPGSKVIDNPTG